MTVLILSFRVLSLDILCRTPKVLIHFKKVTGCRYNVDRVTNFRDLFSLCVDVMVLGPILLCAKVGCVILQICVILMPTFI